MRQQDRFSLILDRLNHSGSVTVGELSGATGASAASVRRDLRSLEEQQLLKRTHGGAVSTEVIYELPQRYRAGRGQQQKRRIAEAAAALVDEDVRSVGLGGGTTTTELARLLAAGKPLKVVTNALNIASDLSVRPSIDLVVTGGGVRPDSYDLVGPIADRALAGISVDVVFLAAAGVDSVLGVSSCDEIGANTDHSMMATGRRVVVLADPEVVGRRAFARVAPVTAVSVVVTGAAADQEELARLRAAGVAVVIA